MFDAMRLVAETGSLAKSPCVELSCAYLDCPSRRKIPDRRDRLVLSDGLLGNKRTAWFVVYQELCSLPDFTAKIPFQICGGRRIMVAARSQEGLG